MPISDAQELFVHELGEVYNAEHQFVEGQQEMAEHATDQDLKDAIQEHLVRTCEHAVNVECVFAELGQKAHRQTNEAARAWSVRPERASKKPEVTPCATPPSSPP